MRRMQREMNRMFSSFGRESFEAGLPALREEGAFRLPLSDVKETDKDVIATIEIPGIEKEDVQLNLTDTTLELKVEKKHETKMQDQNVIREERAYRGFYRSMDLPCKIVPDQAKASCKNGVLEVVMPKAEKKEAKKRIDVR